MGLIYEVSRCLYISAVLCIVALFTTTRNLSASRSPRVRGYQLVLHFEGTTLFFSSYWFASRIPILGRELSHEMLAAAVAMKLEGKEMRRCAQRINSIHERCDWTSKARAIRRGARAAAMGDSSNNQSHSSSTPKMQ